MFNANVCFEEENGEYVKTEGINRFPFLLTNSGNQNCNNELMQMDNILKETGIKFVIRTYKGDLLISPIN